MDNRPPKRPHPFSIATLLSIIQPPPAKRGFFIENLLERQQQQVQSGSGSSSTTSTKAAKEYVKKLDGSIEQNAKFKYGKVKSRFSITSLPADPEGLLMGIIEHCMAEAVESNRQRVGEKPDHIGFLISSRLLETPVWTQLRPINENSADSILNEFMKVAQSKKQDGITLWGEPFTITITTANRAALPNERQIVGGSNRTVAPVHHQIKDNCLIKVILACFFSIFFKMFKNFKNKHIPL